MIDCNGCTKCCQWGNQAEEIGAILTMEEVKSKDYLYIVTEEYVARLQSDPEGNCIYLDPDGGGCMLHDSGTKPQICQDMDCIKILEQALIVAKSSWLEVVIQGAIMKERENED